MTTRIGFSEIPKGLMSTMKTAEEYIEGFNFDAGLLELIRLQVSHINRCAYCIDMHFKEALAAGETQQRLYSVTAWQEAPYYSAQERASLAWAEYITLPTEQYHEQALFERLLTFFNKAQIANLTFAIIQINAWNRLMKSFAIEAGHYQVGQH